MSTVKITISCVIIIFTFYHNVSSGKILYYMYTIKKIHCVEKWVDIFILLKWSSLSNVLLLGERRNYSREESKSEWDCESVTLKTSSTITRKIRILKN